MKLRIVTTLHAAINILFRFRAFIAQIKNYFLPYNLWMQQNVWHRFFRFMLYRAHYNISLETTARHRVVKPAI